MQKRRILILVASLALLGAGCFGGSPAPSVEDSAATARFEAANTSVVQLLDRAQAQGIDITPYQAALTEAMISSTTDIEFAARQMEAIQEHLEEQL